MINSPLHSVSVAGVALDDAGRVLLIRRRDNGQWQAPGGVLELGEGFEQCVVREIEEEAHVTVQPEFLTGIYKNVPRAVVALVYRCKYLSGEPLPSDEASDVRWFAVAEALDLLEPVFAIRVEDALRASYDVAPATRIHDGVRIL